ncbi:hypothetical protein Phi19:1_gp021 [Cellulophaga phage phi19:1]|uniref:Uncharacterized protein n=1 Tax=Cellulophaga phage phi19:1 TaxID=1327970 RepID=R9ZW44_9CAUD|nr:replication initiation protein [Cellulophaga phage phi19:1]AGO47311.1 hypothetical protein Phi19:1_gp021 [Cellulophaga phage phi19:1]
MILDKNYKLTGETYNWVLEYESDLKTKDGKEYKSSNTWYFPKIEQALNKYIDESVKPCDGVYKVIDRLNEIQSILIDFKTK